RAPLPQGDANRLTQSVFTFDPARGMALVRIETRDGYKTEGEFKPGFPPQWAQREWSDFVRAADGLWVPRKYALTTHFSTLFPKAGKDYPAGFNPEKATSESFRFESFAVDGYEATAKELRVNKPLPESTWTLEFPPGTIVNDELRGKVYQVGEVNPGLQEDVRDMTGADSAGGRASSGTLPGGRTLLLFGGVNAAGLGLVWWFYRHRK